MRICVFGAASPTIDSYYITKVEEMGKALAERGHSLTFGGGGNGLMGAAARGFRDGGAGILGVIPKFFIEESVELICDFCSEMITPDTMRERKQIMEDNADAFVIVPGGIGTFEEFFEILTSKQLCRHNKPIAVYNLMGYYDEMYAMLDAAIDKNFLRENCRDLYLFSDDIAKIIEYVETPPREIGDIKELKDG